MAIGFTPDFIKAFNDPAATKVLATVGPDGIPHVVFKGSLHIDEAGRIVLLELTEYSETNRNLVKAIWFDQKVALNLRTTDHRSYHIVGRPERAIIAGPVFERYYQEIRAKLGDVDLSTVWIIAPESLDEKGKAAALKANEGRLPLIHLDRIAARPGA
jgi:hypothetical protein